MWLHALFIICHKEIGSWHLVIFHAIWKANISNTLLSIMTYGHARTWPTFRFVVIFHFSNCTLWQLSFSTKARKYFSNIIGQENFYCWVTNFLEATWTSKKHWLWWKVWEASFLTLCVCVCVLSKMYSQCETTGQQ